MSKTVDELLSRYKQGSQDALLPLLQDIQEEYGFLNEEAIIKTGNYLKLPSSKIYGIATFFDQFRFFPKGRFHIRVCRGTACHLNGSFSLLKELEKVLRIKDGQTTRDGYFSLEAVTCMGACGVGTVININGEFHNAATIADIPVIIENCRKKA
jgi:NADH-quinone oxidoreductase subunit E